MMGTIQGTVDAISKKVNQSGGLGYKVGADWYNSSGGPLDGVAYKSGITLEVDDDRNILSVSSVTPPDPSAARKPYSGGGSKFGGGANKGAYNADGARLGNSLKIAVEMHAKQMTSKDLPAILELTTNLIEMQKAIEAKGTVTKPVTTIAVATPVTHVQPKVEVAATTAPGMPWEG